MIKNYDIKIVDNDFKWEEIPVIEINCPYRDTPDFISAFAQIVSCDNEIRVHMWTIEPERRAVETSWVGSPCLDSCLEFFFSPIVGDSRYFNIEFNSNGCLFLGFGDEGAPLVRFLPEYEDKPLIVPTIEKEENRWDIYYSISFGLIRQFFPEFEVYDGKEMMANCYKCSDKGKYPHYLSWNEITSEVFSFHQPKYFGKMKFTK